MEHRNFLLLLLFSLALSACAPVNPLKDESLRIKLTLPPKTGEVTIEFLGNSTLLITDGKTGLLIDGFITRPGRRETLLGHISPNTRLLRDYFGPSSGRKVDAIFIGHNHADHSLDAPLLSGMFHRRIPIYANSEYGKIHRAFGQPKSSHVAVKAAGLKKEIGRFTVRMVKSAHIHPRFRFQHAANEENDEQLTLPLSFNDFKDGDTFAIHISHGGKALAVTTSAAAIPGQWQGLKADVVFAGIGLLGPEPEETKKAYFEHGLLALKPKLIVPIHWDDFTKPLSKPLRPAPLPLLDRPMRTINLLRYGNVPVRVMDRFDKLSLTRRHLVK